MVSTLFKTIVPKRWRSFVNTAAHSTYTEDGLITCRINDFLFAEKFARAYETGKATGSWGEMDLRWRVYVCCWAAQYAMKLPGDFVECGVNRGGMASAAMKYAEFSESNKRFYLLDTYCGIPNHAKGSSADLELNYTECYEDVRRTFAHIPNVHVIRGAVPSTLPKVESSEIAYLSLDMNNSIPEVAAAEFFWERIVPGGVIILDDYCYSEHYKDQNLAFGNFSRRMDTQILALPTGQGLVFKT
jgi:O-methyltransferase